MLNAGPVQPQVRPEANFKRNVFTLNEKTTYWIFLSTYVTFYNRCVILFYKMNIYIFVDGPKAYTLVVLLLSCL